MEPLNDERFTKDFLRELLCDHDSFEYSYLAGHLMEMISYVEPESNDERTLFGYLENYFRLRKSWKYMEESTDDLYKKIEIGAVTKAIDALIEFCEKWGINVVCYQKEIQLGAVTKAIDAVIEECEKQGINVVCYQDEYSISGNITPPEDQ